MTGRPDAHGVRDRRLRIDALDLVIANALLRRRELAIAIIAERLATAGPVRDPQREHAILDNAAALARDPAERRYLQAVFRTLLAQAPAHAAEACRRWTRATGSPPTIDPAGVPATCRTDSR